MRSTVAAKKKVNWRKGMGAPSTSTSAPVAWKTARALWVPMSAERMRRVSSRVAWKVPCSLRAELARHVLDRRERFRHAHGTVLAHDLGQAPHALRPAVAVRPGVRIDDDADAGHARRLSGWS